MKPGQVVCQRLDKYYVRFGMGCFYKLFVCLFLSFFLYLFCLFVCRFVCLSVCLFSCGAESQTLHIILFTILLRLLPLVSSNCLNYLPSPLSVSFHCLTQLLTISPSVNPNGLLKCYLLKYCWLILRAKYAIRERNDLVLKLLSNALIF